MMNPNDCQVGDSDSNDVLNQAVLANGAVGLGSEDSGNDLFNNANVNHDSAGVLGNGSVMSDDEELPHLLREQDRFLPIANVAKLMKKAIPERGKIAKDAKETVQECVSEFISFITSEAAERCSQEKRKTINGEDILAAMSNLGFDNYVEPLKVYLTKYRESVKCETRVGTNEYSTANENETTHDHQLNYQ